MKYQQSKKSKRIWPKAGIIGIIILTLFSLSACSGGLTYRPVPNVMGVAHSDAKSVLENAGFKVTEVEADPGSILPYIYYNGMGGLDRSIKKGEVFKVNDDCNPNYSDNEYLRMAPDNNVAIYYAKEDYIPAAKPSITEDPDAETSITEDPDAETSALDKDGVLPTLQKGDSGEDVLTLQQTLVDLGYLSGTPDGDFGKQTVAAIKKFQSDMGLEATGIADDATQQLIFTKTTNTEDSDADTSNLATEQPVLQAWSTPTDVEWKQFLKDYEAWVDGYIEILKKYNDNPSDPTILSDYTNSMQELVEWAERADAIKIDLQDSPAALKEYAATLSRILTKLSKVDVAISDETETPTAEAQETPKSSSATTSGTSDEAIYTSGKFQYRISVDGTVEIIKYTGNTNTISIPEELDGRTLTSIGDGVFSGCDSLKTISVPDSVITLGNEVFSGCSKLFLVNLSENLITIGDGVFSDCTDLKTISIPDNVTTLGNEVFSRCSKLFLVNLPENLVTIGDKAFSDCTSLSSISIPDSVTTVGDDIFSGCKSSMNIYAPEELGISR